jgi:hypothetical protein
MPAITLAPDQIAAARLDRRMAASPRQPVSRIGWNSCSAAIGSTPTSVLPADRSMMQAAAILGPRAQASIVSRIDRPVVTMSSTMTTRAGGDLDGEA